MSSTGMRCIDDLGTEHYDDEWSYFGLEDDPLKGGSPPSSSVLDVNLGLSVPVRTCPSPLSQIPTREPYGMEAPPKLSPVPAEQEQTFTTLNTHIPDSGHQFPSSAPLTLADYENDLAEKLGISPSQPSSSSQPSYMQPTTSTTYMQPATSLQSAPLQTSSQAFVSRQQNDLHMMQPSTSGNQHGGNLMQTQSSQPPPQQQQQQQQQQQPQQQQTCIQAVNGQWYVQAQVQHVQTNSGTVIAVLPNYSRNQGELAAAAQGGGLARHSPQQLQHQQQLNIGIVNSQQHHHQQQQRHQQQQHHQQQQQHHQQQQQQQQQHHQQQQQQQQQHQQHQQQQHHQQHQHPQQQQSQQQQQHATHIIHAQQPHHQVMQTAKPVTISTMQSAQGLPVVQQLLSAPTLPRQQMQQQQTVTAQNAVSSSAPKPKQRTTQPRSNGRKKNAGQNGTLGSFLTKANRLAAASNGTSNEASRSSLDSVTLSVQSLEQVSKLTKEITRFQNLQTMQNIDYSREIKDLESKRAQIFFAALVEQHKNEDILSAASCQPKPAPRPANTPRQRNNYTTNSRAQVHNNVQVQHQIQPSTSYERQSTYDTAQQQASNTRQYTASYQQVQYQSYQPTANRNTYVSTASLSHAQQQVPIQQQYYQPANTVRQGTCNTYAQNYEQGNTVATPANQVTVQQRQIVTSQTTSASVQQPLLLSPPQLRTSAEAAAAIAEKRQQRTSRLNTYFSSLQKTIEAVDISKPFEDLSDVVTRLLPFHAYHEPGLNEKVLDKFDHNYLRHMVYLHERKERVERKLRSIFFNEAMKSTVERMDELVLLSLDGEHESRLLIEERRNAAENRENFVCESLICNQLNREDLDVKRAELEKRAPLKPQMPIEYHIFSEAEILARDRGSFSDSETEKELEFSDEEGTTDLSPSCSEDSYESLADDEPTDKDVTFEPLKTGTLKDAYFGHELRTANPGLQKVIKEELEEARIPTLQQQSMDELSPCPREQQNRFFTDLPRRPQPNGVVIKNFKNSPVEIRDASDKSPLRSSAISEHACKTRENVYGVKHNILSKTLQHASVPSTIFEQSSPPSLTASPSLRDFLNIEEDKVEQAKGHFFKEKLKRHWNEEHLSEKGGDVKPISEKIRLRIRPVTHSPEKAASIATDKDEIVGSTSLGELKSRYLTSTVKDNAPVSSHKSDSSVPDGNVKSLTEFDSSLKGIRVLDQSQSDEKFQVNGVFTCPLKIKCNFRQVPEDAREDKVRDLRPPIKIKIALPVKTDDFGVSSEEDKKKEKKKKKKKKKHHQKSEHYLDDDYEVSYENDNEERHAKHQDGHPGCSDAYEATPLSSCCADDSSRGRLLLRFSRKQNNVVKCEPASSPASSCTTQDASAGTPTTLAADDCEPKPKVPKLKIPRIRLKKEAATDGNEASYTLTVKPGSSNSPSGRERENAGKKQQSKAIFVKREPIDEDSNKETTAHAAGSFIEGKPKNSAKRPTAAVGTNGSTLTLNLFPTSSTSSAQFSPGSDASDVEEEKRLRLQTDNVMNRLNGWGSSLPVNNQVQAEALSRIVNSATFMNPLFSGLMTPAMNSWLTNIDQNRFASTRSFPWLVPPSLLPQGAPSQHRSPAAFEKTDFKR